MDVLSGIAILGIAMAFVYFLVLPLLLDDFVEVRLDLVPAQTNIYADSCLNIDLNLNGDEIVVTFTGESNAINPSLIFDPILNDALELSSNLFKDIVLDFYNLNWMNSSSLLPLIHFLDKAQTFNGSILVIYNKEIRWQEMTFDMLKTFQKANQIVVVGK